MKSISMRERLAGPELTSKMADATTGYIHVMEFSKRVARPAETGGRRAGQDRRDPLRRSTCAARRGATSTTALRRHDCS